MIVDRAASRRADATRRGSDGLEHVTPGRALTIGLGAVPLAVAGHLALDVHHRRRAARRASRRRTAAEFSFLLALPTLGAATLYEGFKARHVLAVERRDASLAVGLVVSFLVAWAVIAGFLRYLQHRGLEPFGCYRIALGLLVLWVLES